MNSYRRGMKKTKKTFTHIDYRKEKNSPPICMSNFASLFYISFSSTRKTAIMLETDFSEEMFQFKGFPHRSLRFESNMLHFGFGAKAHERAHVSLARNIWKNILTFK